MRAVITVIGKDTVGILTKVSGICTEYNANVIEVTQSVLQDMFAMIMLVDISKLKLQYEEVQCVKWASEDEIKKMIDEGIFIPYHKSMIDMLFWFRDNIGTHCNELRK